MSSNLIGTRQAAQIAGRHPRTVVSWIRRGWLPSQKLAGQRGPYLIDPDELRAFLKARYTPRPYQPDQQ